MKIMAITNLTPDSFYAPSRCDNGRHLVSHINEQLAQGTDILDFGACSTRPGSTPASEQQEWDRLAPALQLVQENFPEIELSIDSFRPRIVEKAYSLLGRRFWVNDVMAGHSNEMPELCGKLQLPWIPLFGGPSDEGIPVEEAALEAFVSFAQDARHYNIPSVMPDPGFGFGKTMEQNYRLLAQLPRLRAAGYPLLCGISRKRMCYMPFEITPEDCLPETSALHLQLWLAGASVLRVHDIARAVNTRIMANLILNS